MLSPCQSQDIPHFRRGNYEHKMESYQQAAYTRGHNLRTAAHDIDWHRKRAQI